MSHGFPQSFGPYELLRPLGRGGMAEVFLAQAQAADGDARLVALKRMHAGVSEDAAAVEMLVAEARLAAARARIRFHFGDNVEAEHLARQAVPLDERASEGWWVLALVAHERGQRDEEREALRRALDGRFRWPVMMAAMVLLAPREPQACEMAERYLRAAPHGVDAPDVRQVRDRCR